MAQYTMNTAIDTVIPEDEDALLVSSFLSGNATAFDRIVYKYRDRIVNFCVRQVGSAPDGEDLAQDVFVKAYMNLPKFRNDAKLSTWLYRIAVNACKNHRRSWWRRLMQSRSYPGENAGDDSSERDPVNEIGDTSHMPSKDLERYRLAASLEKALQTLSAPARELVLLRDVQGLSYEEIGSVTGLARGTVKSRLSRARSSLQPQLRGIVDGQ